AGAMKACEVEPPVSGERAHAVERQDDLRERDYRCSPPRASNPKLGDLEEDHPGGREGEHQDDVTKRRLHTAWWRREERHVRPVIVPREYLQPRRHEQLQQVAGGEEEGRNSTPLHRPTS